MHPKRAAIKQANAMEAIDQKVDSLVAKVEELQALIDKLLSTVNPPEKSTARKTTKTSDGDG